MKLITESDFNKRLKTLSLIALKVIIKGTGLKTKSELLYGIKCIGFNRWDLYFVMNMLYSDYYNVLGSDTATYVKMSKAWFEDPDVSEGKAYRYYMQVAKA